MEIKEIKKLKKNLPRFFCKTCDFECYMKCDWDRHILRPKHLNSVQGNEKNLKNLKKTYNCECGKLFQSNSGLWKHKNTNECKPNNIIEKVENITQNNKMEEIKEIMTYLIKENSEMKTLMMEVIKTGTNVTNNNNNNSHNTTTNSHNKAFNLNFFLNETCKDAMNIGEFVDSLKLQLSDLEHVGEAGYIEGISSIIVKNLRDLDITKRPVHCTDKKRETVYIKDDNKWEKDEDKSKMHKLIKRVVSKNTKMFDKFREAHPDCRQYHSKFSDQYNKIVYESMGGKGDNDFEKNEKIIKNVLKEVIVDKNI